MRTASRPDLVVTTTSLPNGTDGAELLGDGRRRRWAGAVLVERRQRQHYPAGLSLNAGTGGIAGTPTAAGTSSFTVQVTDGQVPADTATRALQITVLDVSYDPLVITTTSLPNARRNKNYSRTLTATGGLAPYTWSVVSGSLPPGLTLNAATGVISGKATTLGTYAFTVQVRDSQGTPVTRHAGAVDCGDAVMTRRVTSGARECADYGRSNDECTNSELLARDDVSRALRAVDADRLRRHRQRERVVERWLPASRQQIVVRDEPAAQPPRHLADQHVVLDEVSARRVDHRGVVGHTFGDDAVAGLGHHDVDCRDQVFVPQAVPRRAPARRRA